MKHKHTLNISHLVERLGAPQEAEDILAVQQRKGSTSFAEGKRTTKNKSGRGGRKRYHTQQDLRSVGGYANNMRAIYASPYVTRTNEDGTEERVPREMCVVREPEETTWDLGGSCTKGYIGGRATS